MGGPRLVVTADGHRLLALDPPHRRAEVWESESEGVLRLLGAAMGAAELRTLLEGRPPCALETVASESGCPFGDGRYRLERGGSDVRKVSLLDASGRPLVQLEYPMPQPEGADWWREIVLRRQGAPTLRLSLATGPVRSDLDPTLFSTVPPDKFERGQVLGGDGLSAAVEAAPSEP